MALVAQARAGRGLIHVKAAPAPKLYSSPVIIRRLDMPTDTIVVVSFVIAMFAIFSAVMAFATATYDK